VITPEVRDLMADIQRRIEASKAAWPADAGAAGGPAIGGFGAALAATADAGEDEAAHQQPHYYYQQPVEQQQLYSHDMYDQPVGQVAAAPAAAQRFPPQTPKDPPPHHAFGGGASPQWPPQQPPHYEEAQVAGWPAERGHDQRVMSYLAAGLRGSPPPPPLGTLPQQASGQRASVAAAPVVAALPRRAAPPPPPASAQSSAASAAFVASRARLSPAAALADAATRAAFAAATAWEFEGAAEGQAGDSRYSASSPPPKGDRAPSSGRRSSGGGPVLLAPPAHAPRLQAFTALDTGERVREHVESAAAGGAEPADGFEFEFHEASAGGPAAFEPPAQQQAPQSHRAMPLAPPSYSPRQMAPTALPAGRSSARSAADAGMPLPPSPRGPAASPPERFASPGTGRSGASPRGPRAAAAAAEMEASLGPEVRVHDAIMGRIDALLSSMDAPPPPEHAALLEAARLSPRSPSLGGPVRAAYPAAARGDGAVPASRIAAVSVTAADEYAGPRAGGMPSAPPPPPARPYAAAGGSGPSSPLFYGSANANNGERSKRFSTPLLSQLDRASGALLGLGVGLGIAPLLPRASPPLAGASGEAGEHEALRSWSPGLPSRVSGTGTASGGWPSGHTGRRN
jgi:hypothetical protein